ncbi:MAG: hypothetical protein ACJ77A_14775 [Actinomycetota bacterium]
MAKKRRNRSKSRARTAPAAAAAASRATGQRTARGPANRPRKAPAPAPRRGGSVRQGIRRGLGRPLTIGVVALVLLGGYYGYLWLQSRKPPGPLAFASPAPSLAARDLPGLQVGPPPWDAALGSLRARLSELGLPALPSEVTDIHLHLHLDVFVDGKTVPVPDDIGRNQAAGYLTVIHTHDGSGLIHIESPAGHTYTLGQLFDVWGVRFTPTCLGGDCNGGGRLVRVYADGTMIRQDPRLLVLGRHQEILVTYGTAAQVPDPVPSRYGFPLGA